MKKLGLIILLISVLFTFNQEQVKAQTTDLLGYNILNGAVTGSIAGLATMGLRNNDDFAPLRVGLGAGILAGTALAAYDLSTLPSGQQFFISGTFNDGNNSSIIILMDTLYGIGGGSVLGTAIMLIQNEPLVKGLQYGGSIGALAGMGFGMIDSFFLAERNRDFVAQSLLSRSSIFEISKTNHTVGFLQPKLISYNDFSGNMEVEPALGLINFKSSF
ncbi:MAG: hypothetical protein WD381_04060 [Balneolaceae bacterium]